MSSTKTAVLSRLFFVFALLLSKPSGAATLWFYEWMDPFTMRAPQAPAAYSRQAGDQRWLVTEFSHVPYREQLRRLHALPGVQRLSILFQMPAAPMLAEDYADLAKAWKRSGIAGQFKFVGSLPTEQEAELLKPACDQGVQIFFITNSVPTEYEANNLQPLRHCVRVEFVLGRYLKWRDLSDLRRLAGIPITQHNDYYPDYQHVDTLNLIDNPVDLRIQRAMPSSQQVDFLNQIERLKTLTLDFDMYPMESQYELITKLTRSPERKLALRWGWGTPRKIDLEAWANLDPERMQVTRATFQEPGMETQLRALNRTEVIVEMFELKSHALSPRH